MADHQKRIALDSDKAKRAENISNKNARLLANSEDILPQWIVDHSEEVMSLTGSLNFNEWTIEQKKIILDKVSASELNQNLRNFISSNFHVAESYLLEYILENKIAITDDVKIIMPSAVLYFFATSDVDPWAYDGLTDEHKRKLTEAFRHVRKFYTTNKGKYKDARELVKALCKAEQVPAPQFSPMVQGTATNKFRTTATKNIVIDRNGNGTIEQEGFKAFMKDYSRLKGGLTTGAKKLLDAGAIELTNSNHYRAKPEQAINTTVSISLEKYGILRGYEISPRTTETPEEETAEKNRLRNVMCEIRKRANLELDLLYCLSLSWTEPGKKKNADYKDVRVLQSKGIRNGYINMRFSEDMAAYLLQAYEMNYPTALQALDERNPRNYNVGYKLAYHHSIDRNRTKGTNCIIGVESLLAACGDIPTYEEIQASRDRGHWEQRIKEPLEKALDSNVETGVVTSWEYSNSKGVPLNEEQIAIPDYQTFISLYIHFEMRNEPDQSERLQRKAERIEGATAKKQRRKPASKKKDTEGGN